MCGLRCFVRILDQFDGRAILFDEGHYNSRRRTVGRDNDTPALDGFVHIIDLEGHVREFLNDLQYEYSLCSGRNYSPRGKLLIRISVSRNDGSLHSRKKRGAINTKKTAQGSSEASENTRPSVPAVEGIVIKIPDANPIAAMVLENKGLRNMSCEMNKVNMVTRNRLIKVLVPSITPFIGRI